MTKGTRHTSERLINSVGVGMVFVNGTDEHTHISFAERANIVAEVWEGLDWLGGQEPAARVSWVYDYAATTVAVEPWDGARWPGLPDLFYRGIDAAVLREDNGKIYFFRGGEYVRYSQVSAGIDAGYPKPIAGNWPGLPASFNQGIDAALWRESNGKLYFFKGDQYVRFSNVSDGVDAGYPKPIAGNWPGLPAEFNAGIDAALLRKDNHKIYFFKGEQYVRFSNVSAGVDPGYPKPIAGNWKGLPEDFAKSTQFSNGIDAALWRQSNGKVYLFKKHRSVGQYVRFSDVNTGMDAGYPQPIGLDGEEAESLWRDPALAALGQPPGPEGARQYVDFLREKLGTQWAYVAFFTKHPTTWPFYARTPRVIMRYGSENFDRVYAHETGHIFGAPDEYKTSGCKCGKVAGRFFRQPNDNCALCKPDHGDPCIMRHNSSAICAYTPKHFGWGAFLTKIDAAVWRLDVNKLYLFSNDEYVRYTNVSDGRDEGYPKPIAGNWPGLPASFNQGIDAALWRESNGKIYFFKGGQYVRFSNVAEGVDPGYPKPIAGNWPGLPASFNQGIDAALLRNDNHKIYFFKGRTYVRFTSVAQGVDSGYPAWINGNWMPFPQ